MTATPTHSDSATTPPAAPPKASTSDSLAHRIEADVKKVVHHKAKPKAE